MTTNGGSYGTPAGDADEDQLEAAGAHIDVSMPPPGTPLSDLQPYSTTTLTVLPGVAEVPAAAPQQGGSGGGRPDSQANSLVGPFADRLHVQSSDSEGAGGVTEPGQARTSPFIGIPSGDADMADAMLADAALAATAPGAQQQPEQLQPMQQQPEQQQQQQFERRHYWEEEDPGRALAMLEDELRGIADSCCTTSPEAEGCQKLRLMLEAECDAIRSSLAGGPGGSEGTPAGGASSKKRSRVPQLAGGDSSILASLLKHRAGGLQV